MLSSGWHGDAVYTLDAASGRSILRVYRLGYRRRWEDQRPLTLQRLLDQAEVARLMAERGAPVQTVTAGPVQVAGGWAASVLTWLPGDVRSGPTPALVSRIGALLAELHRVGAVLDAGRWPSLPAHDLMAVAERSLEALSGLVSPAFVDDVEARMAAIRHTAGPIPVHGDVNIPNVVWSDERPALIDLDQVGLGWPSEELAWALKWWSRTHGVGDRTHDRALGAALLDGYGSPDALALRPMLWLTGCVNANSVHAIQAASAADRPGTVDRLRRRAEALEALV